MRHLPIAALFLALAMTSQAGAEESLSEDMVQTAQPLLKALSLIGTPYKFGGRDPQKGLDCSGLVKHVYKESAGVELPSSAREMSKQGEQVARETLRPGDLVFFNTRKKPHSHVGIYKGEGEFVHASSNRHKQVTVSRMDDKYWSRHFDGARRLFKGE
ncbi:MAG: C40 family peptidase [Betaproteobacteria bacterium]|nr:C40 family peptidase [Betaproteobacteria bacterium]